MTECEVCGRPRRPASGYPDDATNCCGTTWESLKPERLCLDMALARLRSQVVTMRKALLLVAELELHDKSLHEGNEGDALRAMRAVRAALKGEG